MSADNSIADVLDSDIFRSLDQEYRDLNGKKPKEANGNNIKKGRKKASSIKKQDNRQCQELKEGTSHSALSKLQTKNNNTNDNDNKEVDNDSDKENFPDDYLDPKDPSSFPFGSTPFANKLFNPANFNSVDFLNSPFYSKLTSSINRRLLNFHNNSTVKKSSRKDSTFMNDFIFNVANSPSTNKSKAGSKNVTQSNNNNVSMTPYMNKSIHLSDFLVDTPQKDSFTDFSLLNQSSVLKSLTKSSQKFKSSLNSNLDNEEINNNAATAANSSKLEKQDKMKDTSIIDINADFFNALNDGELEFFKTSCSPFLRSSKKRKISQADSPIRTPFQATKVRFRERDLNVKDMDDLTNMLVNFKTPKSLKKKIENFNFKDLDENIEDELNLGGAKAKTSKLGNAISTELLDDATDDENVTDNENENNSNNETSNTSTSGHPSQSQGSIAQKNENALNASKSFNSGIVVSSAISSNNLSSGFQPQDDIKQTQTNSLPSSSYISSQHQQLQQQLQPQQQVPLPMPIVPVNGHGQRFGNMPFHPHPAPPHSHPHLAAMPPMLPNGPNGLPIIPVAPGFSQPSNVQPSHPHLINNHMYPMEFLPMQTNDANAFSAGPQNNFQYAPPPQAVAPGQNQSFANSIAASTSNCMNASITSSASKDSMFMTPSKQQLTTDNNSPSTILVSSAKHAQSTENYAQNQSSPTPENMTGANGSKSSVRDRLMGMAEHKSQSLSQNHGGLQPANSSNSANAPVMGTFADRKKVHPQNRLPLLQYAKNNNINNAYYKGSTNRKDGSNQNKNKLHIIFADVKSLSSYANDAANKKPNRRKGLQKRAATVSTFSAGSTVSNTENVKLNGSNKANANGAVRSLLFQMSGANPSMFMP